jgi:hypothetical protein
MLIEILRVLCGFPEDSVTTCVVNDFNPYVEVLVVVIGTLMQGRRRQALLREAYCASFWRFHAIYLLTLQSLSSLVSPLNLLRIFDILTEALSIGQNQIQQAGHLLRYILPPLLALEYLFRVSGEWLVAKVFTWPKEIFAQGVSFQVI